MLILDPAFKATLALANSTFCWCWLITRLDGQMLGFTSLDVPITIGNVTYYGVTGFDPGAAQQSQGVDKLDSQNLNGILDRSGISKSELDSGIFNGATVRRFLVDYTNLPSSLELNPPKHRELPTGFIGGFKQTNLGYELQVKDLFSLLNNNIGSTTSKTCRANLGDDDCRVNLAAFNHNLTVTAVVDRRVFSVSGTLSDQYFDMGRLLFTSGQNQGLHQDVSFYAGNQIFLSVPAKQTIAVGDTLNAVAGCVGTKLACITKFRNFANFVGEPDVPTTDLAINTPSRK